MPLRHIEVITEHLNKARPYANDFRKTSRPSRKVVVYRKRR